MAIVFDCPHCKTNYRLKDEFGGKTATCKNPNCRKVIPIPKSQNPNAIPSKPQDIDSIAAMAFSDEPPPQQTAAKEAMIQITCVGCDHVWSVEASKEGKNVLCPECRKANRVPVRKVEQKGDWRGGPNKPSLAKVETGLDREGAFTTANVGGISDQTAREIMKERDAVEEPEVRRKKLIKRGLIGFVVLCLLGAGTAYLVKSRKEIKADGNMADAVKAVREGTKDPKYLALIERASGEYRIRTSQNDQETKEALKDLQQARNAAKTIPSQDKNAIFGEVAVSFAELLGDAEQVDKSLRVPSDAVQKEIRQTLQLIMDSEAQADAVRAVVRKCVEKDSQHRLVGLEAARILGPEMLGQAGLELMRIDREKYRADAEQIVAGSPKAAEPSILALRIVLGKNQPKKDAKDVPAQSPIASAEAAALKGEFGNIKSSAARAKLDDRIKALAAAAQAGAEKNPNESAPLAEEAGKILINEGKGNPSISPWLGVRICRSLAKCGKIEQAEELARKLDSAVQPWAQLEVFRARLAQAKGKKAEEAWLDHIGDPTKVAAAVKAREEIARHNTAAGENYSAIVNSWDKALVKPFGTAGIVLGNLDRK